jgi:hypothetical protein
MDSTHRTCELVVATAEVHRRALGNALQRRCLQPARNEQLSALHVNKGFDGTAWNVMFVRLQTLVAPWARYFLQNEQGKWVAYSLADFQLLSKSRRLPGRGILELLAQQMNLAWLDKSDHLGTGDILVPPRFLQDGTASTIHSAVESAVSGLNIASMIELAKHLRFLFVSEAPDQAASHKTKTSLFTLSLKRILTCSVLLGVAAVSTCCTEL